VHVPARLFSEIEQAAALVQLAHGELLIQFGRTGADYFFFDAVFLRPRDFFAAFFAVFFFAPPFLPPPVSLFTVAHARLAAVFDDTPRFL